MKRPERFQLAQRVNKRGALTSRAGVPVEVSCIRCEQQGCPAYPWASLAIVLDRSSGRFNRTRARVAMNRPLEEPGTEAGWLQGGLDIPAAHAGCG